jgi:hypothetical protein
MFEYIFFSSKPTLRATFDIQIGSSEKTAEVINLSLKFLGLFGIKHKSLVL